MSNKDALMNNIIIYFFRFLGKIPQKYALKLSRILGSFWFQADKRHRTIATENLTRAFGDEKNPADIRELAERTFQHLIRIIFDIGWYLHICPEEFHNHFRIEGLEHLSNALSKGKGVLALTAHIGNWEMLSAISAMTDTRVTVVYRPLDFLPLENFFANLRTRFGATLISKANSMRKILSSLKSGETVVMLMDQNVDWYEGVFADYFGHLVCTSKGLALIALKTGAPVVPAFLVRDASGFLAQFCPEIPLIRTGDKIKDVEENTRQYNKAIEDFVRRFPDQWFWVHQRFKTKSYCPLSEKNG
jgi:KDO2-lipid IV(A) lauroyltransferase